VQRYLILIRPLIHDAAGDLRSIVYLIVAGVPRVPQQNKSNLSVLYSRPAESGSIATKPCQRAPAPRREKHFRSAVSVLATTNLGLNRPCRVEADAYYRKAGCGPALRTNYGYQSILIAS